MDSDQRDAQDSRTHDSLADSGIENSNHDTGHEVDPHATNEPLDAENVNGTPRGNAEATSPHHAESQSSGSKHNPGDEPIPCDNPNEHVSRLVLDAYDNVTAPEVYHGIDLLRKESKTRSAQSMLYASQLETRVKHLEKQLDELLRVDQDQKEPKGDGDGKSFELAQLHLTEITHLSWSKWWSPITQRDAPWEVVQVLREKPQAIHNVLVSEYFRRRFKSAATSSHPAESREVQRIRLNSPHISQFFKGVMGTGAPDDNLVFLQPFKPVVAFAEELREYILDLEDVRQRQQAMKLPPPMEHEPQDNNVNTKNTSDDSSTPSETGTPEQSRVHFAAGTPPLQAALDEVAAEDLANNSSMPDAAYGPETEPPVSKETIDHLRCFLRFVDEDLKDHIDMQKQLRSGQAEGVAFKDLWYLFAPGDTIYDKSLKQGYRVYSVKGGRTALSKRPTERPRKDNEDHHEGTSSLEQNLEVGDESSTPLTIDCFSIDFNGEDFGPVHRRIKIASYDGELPIRSLPVAPLGYEEAGSKTGLKQYLAKRGEKFQQLADPDQVAHREYVGFSLGINREQVDSQVIIDPALYFELHPFEKPSLSLSPPADPDRREITEMDTCNCYECLNAEGRNIHIYDDFQVDRFRTEEFLKNNVKILRRVRDAKGELDPDQAILLPPKVHGYVLRSRKWLVLDVDKLTPVTKRAQNFEDLVLPEEHKTLVEGLVRTHSKSGKSAAVSEEGSAGQDQVNLVRGKGKGVIILLHGVPGVGKTSTAECVAEYTSRPLFSITCGDIGETPRDVQDNLELNFQLAHRWGCVMLLDEADVFLQARDKRDLKRNAVVSVFLRILEYYSGILFLTTNKVGNFDEAFKSRIHISLYYAPLNRKQSREIWSVNLRRIGESHPDLEFDRAAILDWALENFDDCEDDGLRPWNGRQIYNACQTALAIAQFQGKGKMTKQNFNTVAKASKQFDEYLEKVHGGDDAALAQRLMYRYDDAPYIPLMPLEAERLVNHRGHQRSKRAPSPFSGSYRARNDRHASDRRAGRVAASPTEGATRRRRNDRGYGSDLDDEGDDRSPSIGARRRLRRQDSLRDR